jgi:hypothetical protein
MSYRLGLSRFPAASPATLGHTCFIPGMSATPLPSSIPAEVPKSREMAANKLSRQPAADLKNSQDEMTRACRNATKEGWIIRSPEVVRNWTQAGYIRR